MAVPTTACWAATLNQQRQQTLHHYQQCDEHHCHEVSTVPCKTKQKTCTVVENGRVVVKPVQSTL